VITPESHSMQDAVVIMTGAMTVPDDEQTVR
jgi:fructose transport system ATP-binding protein